MTAKVRLILMKGLTFFLVFLLIPSFCFAASIQGQRKVEEEARQQVRSVESLLPVVVSPQAQENLPVASANLSYFEKLLFQKYTTRSDILCPLIILLGADVPAEDQVSRIHLLKEKKILPVKLAAALSPDEPLTKGLASFMFCRALKVKGGLLMRLIGINQRYAFNELVFLNIMPQGSIDDIVTGQELVGIFTNAAEYLADKNSRERGKS
jgi:hypothetical protein